MTFMGNMASENERLAKEFKNRATVFKKAAEMFESGFKEHDVRLQIRAVLPVLGKTAKGSFVQDYTAHDPQLSLEYVLVGRDSKGRRVAADNLSPAEEQLLATLNAMVDGDDISRIFWEEAAVDVAAMEVEDFSRGEFAHYCRCRTVAKHLWPEEDDTMPELWRDDWDVLKVRLSGVKASPVAA